MHHNRKKLWLATITLLAAFALSMSFASAALEITTFSCNGQGNPAVVESGSAMNCVARIANTDSQNAANVGTVSLAVSGGWAEETSYSVVLNKNILAGGSEDVTFQNIRSITPGNSHAFSHVDVDGTAHTEVVSSYLVNALAIKSLTATSSLSSASTSSTFDISSVVRAGGDFISMTLAISLSGGCSLSTGQTASHSMGALSNNAQTSTSWTVTQGSSNCVVTVTATGTSSPVTLTDTKSVTVTNPTAATPTPTSAPSSAGAASGAAGGAGGAGGAGTAAATKFIGELGLEKVTKTLALGETLKFAILTVNHTIAVKNVTATNVTIEVASTPQVATLKVGETRKFDLDADSVFDVSITLNKIENWEAELVLEVVSPELIEKIKAAITATPTPTGTAGVPSGSPTAPSGAVATPTQAAGAGLPTAGAPTFLYILIAVLFAAAIAFWVLRKKGGKVFEEKERRKPSEKEE